MAIKSIRKITIQVSTRGVSEAASALNKMAAAIDSAAAAQQRFLSAQEAYARQLAALRKKRKP